MQARSMCGAGPYKQFLDVRCYIMFYFCGARLSRCGGNHCF